MPTALHIATICLTTIVLCTALAHVLEWPGKMRLDRRTYVATQAIYYPGFTIAGFAEVLAIVAAGVLLLVSPRTRTTSWLEVAAFGALVALHATYWLMTHQVNKFWLKDEKLTGFGREFFSVGSPAAESQGTADQDQVWRRCRDRWELSHAIRAAFGVIAFLLLLFSLAMGS